MKNVTLNEPTLIEIGNALGDELIILPEALSFNNKDPRYPEIARVGNILIDGSKKDSSKDATIWHQDGAFWDPSNSNIFNLLLSVIVPEAGGHTQFADLV